MMMLDQTLSCTPPSAEACALFFSAVALGGTTLQFEETAGTLPDNDAHLPLERECSRLSGIPLQVDMSNQYLV